MPRKALFLQGGTALLAAAAAAAGRKAVFCGSVTGSAEQNRFLPLGWEDALFFLLFAAAFFLALRLLERGRASVHRALFCPDGQRAGGSRVFFLFWALLCLAWLPYLLTLAPGSVLGDSLSSLELDWKNNHHPVLYNLYVQLLFRLGSRKSANCGIFLYTLIQYAVLSGALAGILRLLYDRRLRLPWLLLALGFYAFFPVFPSYAVILWKDPLFSLALAGLSFLLPQLGSDTPRRRAARIGAVLGVCFLRNNGIYICAGICMLLLLRKCRGKGVRRFCLLTLLCVLIQGPGYRLLGIEGDDVEAFSIPLQQLGYVISEEGDTLTEPQLERLSAFLPAEEWKEAYTPCLADSVKWHADFDNDYFESHKKEFLLLWAELLPEHPGGYVKAYLLETLGFWHPTLQNGYGYIDQYILPNGLGIHAVDLFERLFGVSLQERLESFRPMLGSGLLFWAAAGSLSLCSGPERRKRLYYAPQLLCWAGIMVATPVAFSLRYVFILLLLLPVNLVWPFSEARAAGEETT